MGSEPQPQQLNKVQDCKWISCVLELERDVVVVWLYGCQVVGFWDSDKSFQNVKILLNMQFIIAILNINSIY